MANAAIFTEDTAIILCKDIASGMPTKNNNISIIILPPNHSSIHHHKAYTLSRNLTLENLSYMAQYLFFPFFGTFSKYLHKIFEICICHEKFVIKR